MNLNEVLFVGLDKSLFYMAMPSEHGKRRVKAIFDHYLEWVEDSMTTEPAPFLQVVAVFRAEPQGGVA